jgi:hypothetical protein
LKIPLNGITGVIALYLPYQMQVIDHDHEAVDYISFFICHESKTVHYDVLESVILEDGLPFQTGDRYKLRMLFCIVLYFSNTFNQA